MTIPETQLEEEGGLDESFEVVASHEESVRRVSMLGSSLTISTSCSDPMLSLTAAHSSGSESTHLADLPTLTSSPLGYDMLQGLDDDITLDMLSMDEF